MSAWSLRTLLAGLHDDIQGRLDTARKTLVHPGAKGDASEKVWLELLQTYLPQRYRAASAFVVDSTGQFSDQIDVVVYDRQYSPLIFQFEGQTIIPAESVYAVFEAKQTTDAANLRYAREKVASVRRLHRTSQPIPHAGGIHEAKPPSLVPILGGVLAFESRWIPALGPALVQALAEGDVEARLDLGCVAAHGHFSFDSVGMAYRFTHGGKPATGFLFDLIALLQASGTVPMLDVRAYARWLE